MESLTDSQKLTLTETYTSRYNVYTAKNDLFDTLTIYGKKYYYIFQTILKHVRKVLEEIKGSYVGFVILEVLVDGEIKINNLNHLLMKDKK